MIAGSIHPIQLFEFFHTLRKNDWDGVWQLDQFPFREDSVEAANAAIDFLQQIVRALDVLDTDALAAAQATHDAVGALREANRALYSAYRADPRNPSQELDSSTRVAEHDEVAFAAVGDGARRRDLD